MFILFLHVKWRKFRSWC